MLISEAISHATALTGQVVATAELVRWLSELDGRLAFETFRVPEWHPYDPTDDTGLELLVEYPHDGLYVHWLAAQTYFSNGEYDRCENERAMFERALADYKAWLMREKSTPCRPGYPTDKTGGSGG